GVGVGGGGWVGGGRGGGGGGGDRRLSPPEGEVARRPAGPFRGATRLFQGVQPGVPHEGRGARRQNPVPVRRGDVFYRRQNAQIRRPHRGSCLARAIRSRNRAHPATEEGRSPHYLSRPSPPQ